ncbi:heme biosynthesis HemY N-terminal domain-containing protein [Ningiella sp. W23]|uniref:heme biosynthesis HemY N-terminal domain-containing protein n=1 Tax=Ningiella sp. W23 TaxID=3023715 RepID=UPI00375822BC
MIKVIILLLILFFALMFGHTLIGQEGMVIIALPETVIEMSIISAVIVAFFSIVATFIIFLLIRRIWRAVAHSRNWFGSYSKRQQQKAFHLGLNAYLIGDFENALKHVKKSFGGDFAGSNYVLAADIDARLNKGGNIDAMLAKAQVDAPSKFQAIVKQAQLGLADNKPDKALEVLAELDDKDQKQESVVQLKLQALAKLERWTDIRDVLSDSKKVLKEDHVMWAQRAMYGEFAEVASKQGANALKEKWQNLSRSARKDVANQICYAQLLIEQGMSEDAQHALIEFAKKQEHDAYWGLFKQLCHSSLTPAIRFVEDKIKKQPENARLYSVLAHLAYNSDDFDLAERAINKAIEINRTQEDMMLLAAILEKRNAFESANALYKSLVH